MKVKKQIAGKNSLGEKVGDPPAGTWHLHAWSRAFSSANPSSAFSLFRLDYYVTLHLAKMILLMAL